MGLVAYNDLMDASLGEIRRIGDLLLGAAEFRGLADQDVPTLDQVLALGVYAADLLSQFSKLEQRAFLAGHHISSKLRALLVAMTTSVLAER